MVERVVMGEMVERVARSLARSEAMVRGVPPSDDGWEYWQFAARGVLGALREPTDAMLAAAVATLVSENKGFEYGPHDGWRAMIDAALED